MTTHFLLNEVWRKEIVKKGNFVLKSGQNSTTYVDCRELFQYPELLNAFANAVKDRIKPKKYEWVAGVPFGGIPVATLVSNKTNIPLLLVRNEQKEHGTKRLVEGTIKNGDRVLLIEDVVTTGGSVIATKKMLEDLGASVDKMICFINRSGDVQCEANQIEGLIPFNELHEPSNMLLPKLGKKIIWAADVDTMEEMFSLLDRGYGERIGILKLHIDTFNDFSVANVERLIDYKKKYDLILWEDRKFADIGMIIAKQIRESLYCYDMWVDVFSIHSLMGDNTILSLMHLPFKWILIGEMSPIDNLMKNEYVSASLDIYHRYDNIIGFVTQHDMGKDVVHIVPGISQIERGDSAGQCYSTPLERQFADFYVVGRSINDWFNIPEYEIH